MSPHALFVDESASGRSWAPPLVDGPPDEEPPTRDLQAALRTTTEWLAREIATPSASAPDWSPLEWRTARAAAAIHGISPLLSWRLRWQGPDGWQRFLSQQRSHAARRHEQMRQMREILASHLAAAGVAAIPLRGAALQSLGLYPRGRPVADLDLLVLEPELERAAHVLRSLGLAPWVCNWRERIFAGVSHAPRNALGEHPGQPIRIGLYTRIGEKLPLRITDITGHILPSDPQPGLNPYHSPAALMAHLLLNAAGAMAARCLRLLDLHDIALLALRMHTQSWCDLLDLRTGGYVREEEGPWWALPPLLLTARYYPNVVPAHVVKALYPQCHPMLRRASRRQQLTDVSQSQLWIEAFPGLEWSRSAAERLDYMRNRIHPDEATLQERTQTRRTADWAAYNSWCMMSQRQRMLRWLVQRQTRPVSIHAVRAAFIGP